MWSEKICTKCGHTKNMSEFYKDQRHLDGLQSHCKKCFSHKRKVYQNTEKGKKAHRKGDIKYRRTKKGKEANRKASKRQRLKRPEKIKARNAANYLTKCPCEVCGKIEVEAHHDDYSKPLDVRWLCKKHHTEITNNNTLKGTT